jgi:hypothetical protein
MFAGNDRTIWILSWNASLSIFIILYQPVWVLEERTSILVISKFHDITSLSAYVTFLARKPIPNETLAEI